MTSKHERTGGMLPEFDEARRALREGRVDDLPKLIEEAADAIGEEDLLGRLQLASLYQAAFRFTARPELRDRGLQVAGQVADRMDEPAMAVLARGILATIHLVAGRLHAVADTADAALELAEATGVDDPRGLGLAHQFRGYALFEWNRLDEARQELERAWELTDDEHGGIRSGVARMMTALAAVQGNADEAELWFGRLETIVGEPMTLRNREWLAAVRMRHGLQTDRDLRAIDAWRQRYDYRSDVLSELEPREVLARLHELEHLMTILEETSQWEPLEQVAGIVSDATGEVRPWFTVRALAARAVALEALGRSTEAEDGWSEALVRGSREGYARAYLDGSPVRLRLLLREVARGEGAAAREAGRVLETTQSHDSESPALTPKQLEVLGQVAGGLSNREIAESLGVAETTVKTHLREIYARLQVGSRTAAVAKGRRLGMV